MLKKFLNNTKISVIIPFNKKSKEEEEEFSILRFRIKMKNNVKMC